MAYTAMRLACQLADQLKKERLLSENRQGDDVLKEIFRAYFCLANLHTMRHLQNSASNSYRVAMIESLREYESELVRETFLNAPALDEAMACYVQGRLSPEDRKAIDDCRHLLHLSEDNALQFFGAKVYVRTMRLLGTDIQKILFIGDIRYLTAVWSSIMSYITGASVKVFNDLTPVMEE